ncbi:MAG: FG-GAP repeat protein [Acidobacteriota bacterium]
MRWQSLSVLGLVVSIGGWLGISPASAQPDPVIDLATVSPDDGVLRRVYGATGDGRFGLPVAGGHDVDGDGFIDYAVAFMLSDSPGLLAAGEVDLIFGDGTTAGIVDTATDDPRALRFYGTQRRENAGSEIWMDDVTGDGLGDLLISRQNFTPGAGRLGAGALTIVVGGPALRDQAQSLEPVDLSGPPQGIVLTTLVGPQRLDRLGIWMRTGDVDGDGVADIVVGADQEDLGEEPNRGAAYVIRGGAHLVTAGLVDLAQPELSPLAGHIAKITPPPGSAGYHLGATCQIADLDGNGRGEVLLAAALNRAGASLEADGAPPGSAEPSGGAPDGTVYIAWDDNFPAELWPADFSFDISASPGGRTAINGENFNVTFGEEILGGLDYDLDGSADLFVGDLVADGTADRSRPSSGLGHVLFDAAALRGREFDMETPPADLRITRILGPSAGAIAADTAAHGDFDGDGASDLAFTSPHAQPQGRDNAGAVHVLFGRAGGWPSLIDLSASAFPAPEVVRVAEVQGAQGAGLGDVGDTLGYSAAAGDVDGDGLTDLIVNEMVGNGLAPDAVDVGNLLVLSGRALRGESCVPSPNALCLSNDRFRVEATWEDFNGVSGEGQAAELTDDTGTFWFFDAANVELVVKVLDACVDPFNRFWVFAGGLTDVGVVLTVTDTVTGERQVYSNALGNAFQPIRDTDAFATCPADGGASSSRSSGGIASTPGDIELAASKVTGACTPNTTTLCLSSGRFAVQGSWQTVDGAGEAQAVMLTGDTGYLWFFGPTNVEALVKVLDACGLPGFESFWVFAAGLTDVGVELTVTDRVSGQVRSYSNELGTAFQPIQQTDAFRTCP